MIRSPLYYSGDKFKVLKPIIDNIESNARFIDLFMGGGSILANITNDKIIANDNNQKLIEVLKFIHKQESGEALLKQIIKIIDKYNLTKSFEKKYQINGNKKYFSEANKEAYISLRKNYNSNPTPLKLIVLIIYGYNRLMRFNSDEKFNVPVGTLDLNKNVVKHIIEYTNAIKNKDITFLSKDYTDVLKTCKYGDIIFVDPPYLISNAEYNQGWNKNKEEQLYNSLEKLMKNKKVTILLTNYSERNGVKNTFFNKWKKKYKNIKLESFHYSYHNNKGFNAKEYLVIARSINEK